MPDEQLAFWFDFPMPTHGALSIRQAAIALGRLGSATRAYPHGKPNFDFVLRLIEDGEILAQTDDRPGQARKSYRICASSLRLYIAKTMSRRPEDYRVTVENAALNLTPAELRKLAAFATAAADEKEARFKLGAERDKRAKNQPRITS